MSTGWCGLGLVGHLDAAPSLVLLHQLLSLCWVANFPWLSGADYGNVEFQPPVDDMFEFFKDQLEMRRAGSRSPLQINTFYDWCEPWLSCWLRGLVVDGCRCHRCCCGLPACPGLLPFYPPTQPATSLLAC